MNTERAAEVIVQALRLSDAEATYVTYEPEEDMRSGGWFFDIAIGDKEFTVLVTEVSA